MSELSEVVEKYNKLVEPLYEEFGHLFVENGRGIEAPTGWMQHIKTLLNRLEWERTHNTHNAPDGVHEIRIFQIKEKFGQLRVYVQANSEFLQHRAEVAVAKCEGACEFCCEICGDMHNYGIASYNKWISSICGKCSGKDQKNG